MSHVQVHRESIYRIISIYLGFHFEMAAQIMSITNKVNLNFPHNSFILSLLYLDFGHSFLPLYIPSFK